MFEDTLVSVRQYLEYRNFQKNKTIFIRLKRYQVTKTIQTRC